MRNICLKSLLVIFLFSVFLYSKPNVTFAQQAPPVQTSITTSASVGSTSLTFIGRTSPSSIVYIYKDGEVIGTTSANLSGEFTKEIVFAKPPGLITIHIGSIDLKDRDSRVMKFVIAVAAHTKTTINQIVLSPTVEIEEHTITRDERVRIRGRGVPGSTVVLFFFDDKRTKSTDIDEFGNWTITIFGKDFEPKKYELYAKVFSRDGYKSSESHKLKLEILPGKNDLVEVVQEPPPLIEVQEFICELPVYFSPFDTDSNCKVNYNEFQALITSWYDEWLSRGQCDLDDDTDCDLVDFSIVMYYVNR